MVEHGSISGLDPPLARESYTVGYNAPVRDFFQTRSSDRFAQFFMPNLRPGMSLLDCGSGPGSITVGLAEALAPGEVVGIDIAAVQVETARKLAETRGITNVRFEVGDIYALQFPDNSFDAAYASHVLHHLRDPLRALSEIRRVVRPGGMVGIIDPDWGSWLLEPSTELLRRYHQLHMRIQEHNGGDYGMARHNRGLLSEAGFVRVEGSAIANYVGTAEGTRLRASVMLDRLADATFTAVALEKGWASEAELAAMADDARAWGDSPHAFWSVIACSAIGWVPETEPPA